MQTLLSALAFKLFVRSVILCCASDVCDVSVAKMENARSRLGRRKPRITPHHIRNFLILNNRLLHPDSQINVVSQLWVVNV